MVRGVVPPRWAELWLKEMVQGLEPSGMPERQGMPKSARDALPSGADSCKPVGAAVTVTDAFPAAAAAVTLMGASPVARTHVPTPTRVVPRSPIFRFVSTVGAGILTNDQATSASHAGTGAQISAPPPLPSYIAPGARHPAESFNAAARGATRMAIVRTPTKKRRKCAASITPGPHNLHYTALTQRHTKRSCR